MYESQFQFYLNSLTISELNFSAFKKVKLPLVTSENLSKLIIISLCGF